MGHNEKYWTNLNIDQMRIRFINVVDQSTDVAIHKTKPAKAKIMMHGIHYPTWFIKPILRIKNIIFPEYLETAKILPVLPVQLLMPRALTK